jgi:hypothetical protein
MEVRSFEGSIQPRRLKKNQLAIACTWGSELTSTRPVGRLPCSWVGCDKHFIGNGAQMRLNDHVFNAHHNHSQLVRCPHTGCQKSFVSMEKWRIHSELSCCPVKRHTCSWPSCGRHFNCPSLVKEHIAEAHHGIAPTVSCSYSTCKKMFTSTRKMKDHRQYHTMSSCSQCKNRIPRSNYQSHLSTCLVRQDKIAAGACIGSRRCAGKMLDPTSYLCEKHQDNAHLHMSRVV